jgi:hypothetical protein
MPSVYPFVFYRRPRKGQQLKLAFHVDGIALMNVVAALYCAGYELGEIQLNYPPPRDGAKHPSDFDPNTLERDGLIVSATRVDFELANKCRKIVQKGYTPLERWIEAAWRGVIQRSERLQMILQVSAAQYLAEGFETRRNIEFNEREGARYSGFPDDNSFRANKNTPTAAYLLRLRELWPGGPGYLGFFGMDSTAALAWSHLLRHRHADLLHTEGFFMAELSGPLPGHVSNLRWADAWRSEIILRAPAIPPTNFSLSQSQPQQPRA